MIRIGNMVVAWNDPLVLIIAGVVVINVFSKSITH